MPTEAIRRRLVPTSFHQELARAMAAAGFSLMYRFTATTDRDTYHVPAQYAQEITHFFYLPERGFLVQLDLAEHIDEQGRYRSWWSGTIYLQLDTNEMIAYEVLHICPQHRGPRFFMDECDPLGHVLGSITEQGDTEGLFWPFSYIGGGSLSDDDDSFSWNVEYSGPLTVKQLVGFMDGLRTHFGPFLKPTLTHNFSAFGFTNDYAWPDIRERFWRSFPTRLLKSLVPGRIRGRESIRTPLR